MKASTSRFTARCLAAAVQAALAAIAIAPAAYAEDEKVLDLTIPKDVVDIGPGYVSDSSAKFGEYNGLNKKGPYLIGNIDLRGGGYGSDTDAMRYSITGTNLGLDTRNITATWGEQGKYKLNLGYDELTRERSDSYQTPYLGTGTSNFTLPSTWIVPRVPQVSSSAGNFRGLDPTAGTGNALVGGVSTPPTAAQVTQVNNIIAADVPLFQEVDLHTKRTTYEGGVVYNINSLWDVKASVSHQYKDGYKPMNFLSAQVGTSSVTLPDPIDQTHDQFNASVNYVGPQGFFTAAYYGSMFKNTVNSVTWQNPFDPTKSSTFSSAPDNQFHQFLATGGYKFSQTTKLVMDASYARATQDVQFLQGPETPFGLPTNSLQGKVVTTTLDAKLTSRPTKDLNLQAAYKFDDHDNQTAVNTYRFYDAQEAASGTSPFNAYFPGASMGSNINIYENRPYSKKLNQFDADADYRLAKNQWLKFTYEYQKIDRKCEGDVSNCADAPETRENSVRAEWRMNMVETLNARVDYVYSQRRVDYDPNAFLALTPMSQQIPTGATSSVAAFLQANGLGGFGPMAPYTPLQPGNLGLFFPNNSSLVQAYYGSRNDIHELPGMERFNMADRNRDKLRSAINWQANDKLSVDATLDYNHDDYSNSAFGLQKAQSWVGNLEGAYSVDDNTSASLFYTYEDQRSNSAGWSYSSGSITNASNVGGVAGNTMVQGGCFSTVSDKNVNAKIDPCLQWAADMRDQVDTVGFGFKRRGFMGGRLDVGADLLWTRSRSTNNMAGGTYANNPAAAAGRPAVNPAAFFIPAQNLPIVTTETTELRLTAQYMIDKVSSLRIFYWYQKLDSTDYAYDGMQYGTITSVMPTLEKAPNYNVSVVGLSYQYRFR
ncbi:MAG: MtrB/PioB family decaheme-associated outer membrane protein [Usitatibacter sp.]